MCGWLRRGDSGSAVMGTEVSMPSSKSQMPATNVIQPAGESADDLMRNSSQTDELLSGVTSVGQKMWQIFFFFTSKLGLVGSSCDADADHGGENYWVSCE